MMKSYTQSILKWCKQHLWVLLVIPAVIVGLIIAVVVGSYLIINPYKQYVLSSDTTQQVRVGIVLGSGITSDGKPSPLLQGRLDVAADALANGIVQKLILSGDNRFLNYNEPQAMYDYLVTVRGIPAEKLQPDYAGRDTYSSCERAAKIFGVNKLIVFSSASHLPRAIYLCWQQGIETYGIGSTTEANNSTRRELLARVKAVINANIVAPPVVLGEPIDFN